ncbi:PIR protein CIR protein [Plasmodium vinckei vinckei]|uniref:PIR protein CIR protein n=1 Tax=Plasmodium vinckei vinckei TaxID=54757 RepID=A0A449BM58_PLAVN|nr:PIR protein CIR protein [Plasmodium vinckei vinckei]VEV54536.1 PIR protein CIR protein [Plasmodium vinckei vinckei]
MASSCYYFKDVSSEFKKIDKNVGVENGGNVEYVRELIFNYCPYNSIYKSAYCNNYFEKANSGVIYFLETLKEKFDSKYDKLAEYAILLLCYKLNEHSEHIYKSANLNKFYTDHIEKNKYYNNKINENGPSYKDIIDKKKDLMNMNIKEILKFYEALKTLCNMYDDCNKTTLDCNNCSENAKTFANQFKELNKDSKNIDNISYSQMLSTLSNDYDNLKYIYDNNKCPNSPPLPMIKTPSSKFLPALSTFSVIPVFLGVAYKYSLFGIDKLFQRQYIRKKLNKLKKKMKLNI